MVEARRIELRSKAAPWQVSTSLVANWVLDVAHLATRAWRPSRFLLFPGHTDYVSESISLDDVAPGTGAIPGLTAAS